jgi:hypothetical protein
MLRSLLQCRRCHTSVASLPLILICIGHVDTERGTGVRDLEIGLDLTSLELLLWHEFRRKVTEGTMRILRSEVIFPGLVHFVSVLGKDVAQVILG